MPNGFPIRLDTSYLLVSIFWSAIGTGYCLYGKKQRSMPPFCGGLGLIAVSWLITSVVWMSLASIGVIVATHWWLRHDDSSL